MAHTRTIPTPRYSAVSAGGACWRRHTAIIEKPDETATTRPGPADPTIETKADPGDDKHQP